MKRLLLLLVAAGLLTGLALPALAQVTYTPLVLAGFTADVVANGSGPAASVTTAPFDQGSAMQDSYCLVAQGYVSPTAGTATRGLPASGLLQNLGSTTPGLVFQLQPYFAANSLRIAGTGTGTLTLAIPQAAQSVWVAASTGNGDPSGTNPVTMTVLFTDGTTQAFSRNVDDWFGGASFIVNNLSRVNRNTDAFDLAANEPRIYQFELPLLAANYTKLVQRVQFSKTQPAGVAIPVVFNGLAVTLASVCSLPVASAQATPATLCPGQSTTLLATLAGGSGALTQQWQSSPDGITWTDIAGATGPSYSATPTANTYYRLRLTCSTGTTTSSAVLVTVVVPRATLAYGASTYCRTGTSGVPSATPAGGTFSAPAGLSLSATTGELNLAGSAAGTYTVTYTSGGQCPATARATVTVLAPVATLAYAATTYCRVGTSGVPAATPAGGTFSAAAGLALNNSTGAIDLSASVGGTYTVAYTSGGQCPATALATVLVKGDELPVFPNVLTPNGDGANDVLRLRFQYAADLTGFHLQVFNRWGRRVYDGNRATEGWDPANSSPGTYYYLADYTDCAGRPQSHKTWVEVVK